MGICFRQQDAFRTGAKRFRGNRKSPVRSPENESRFYVKMQFPERIKVLQPDGSVSRWVSEHEARELIRTRTAEGLGNKRKFYALRLLRAERSRSEQFRDALTADKLKGVPVIRPYELLAPSPRRNFGYERAVNRRKPGSSQHGVYAHSLANQCGIVSG